MADTTQTTLVCLFHTKERASNALADLEDAGIPRSSIQVLDGARSPSTPEHSLQSLQGLGLPEQDLQVLGKGLANGGSMIVVQPIDGLVEEVETIFERYHADEIDERETNTPAAASVAAASEGVIPVVQEELLVGKRTVARGGVRVFSRVVETPVEERVTLREEHARVERVPVNRPISEAELNSLKTGSVEVQELAEEPVIAKTARVTEEILVGKDTTERTAQIKDTIRKTEVEVDELNANRANRND